MSGLAQYSEFFENPVFTRVINEKDAVDHKMPYIGARFLPLEETFDLEFHETTIERQADMANIVDMGAELPLTDRDPVKAISGSIVDIGQAYIVTKKEMAALLLKGAGGEGQKNVAVKQLLNKSTRLRQNVEMRIEWMRWKALGPGIMAYKKDGIYLGADFGHLPEHTKVAGIKWDGVTPTIIADYEAWVQQYLDKNGFIPDVFVTSKRAINTVLNDVTVRKMVHGLTEQLLTLDQLNNFLEGRDLPKMESYDAKVTYRDISTGGARATSRLLDENIGIFLVEGGEIGSMLLGPTVENDMNPGIYGRTYRMESPMRDIVEVVASAFPKILKPEYIMKATIL